ncbi:hypothetical protein C900_01654 [Fulvivirga imtechensis AK7]|uniref:Uncharacterized protein n=1 Tax=Fulvivirga imtechensis AK7 TaxID=1237149 RepID=L8JYT7_9BACT|nr:hypothetical protein C900_01654 [Fulvivirga imtechensis AK7]
MGKIRISADKLLRIPDFSPSGFLLPDSPLYLFPAMLLGYDHL